MQFLPFAFLEAACHLDGFAEVFRIFAPGFSALQVPSRLLARQVHLFGVPTIRLLSRDQRPPDPLREY